MVYLSLCRLMCLFSLKQIRHLRSALDKVKSYLKAGKKEIQLSIIPHNQEEVFFRFVTRFQKGQTNDVAATGKA